jgi:DHA1 family bicyclomycin/chloramphenicol resistance-like MFS transporter
MTTALILTLALQSAVPPFATDMYTPAFPRVTADLATSAALVGLTLTTFFLFGSWSGSGADDDHCHRVRT